MYMNYITTTDLRTKSPALITALEKGESVTLVHRSKIVGRIIPDSNTKIRTVNAKKLSEKINKLRLPKLTLPEIEKRYRAAMMKKHGKGLS